MSVKEPWDSEWKKKCRSRIKGCDGMIALLSSNSSNASGEKWEISCAKEEGVPLIGIYIHTDDKSSPSEMDGVKKIRWTSEGIEEFINSL